MMLVVECNNRFNHAKIDSEASLQSIMMQYFYFLLQYRYHNYSTSSTFAAGKASEQSKHPNNNESIN